MFSVSYRFKSNREEDTQHFSFNNAYVSVRELKDYIENENGLSSGIQLEDAETGEVYRDDGKVVKNSLVLVSRIAKKGHRTLDNSVNHSSGKRSAFVHQVQPPSLTYICNRCRKPGHYIQNCPTNGNPDFDRPLQRFVGIPLSMTKRILSGDTSKPTLMLPDGNLAVLVPNDTVFEAGRASLLALEAERNTVPSEFRCSMCQALLNCPLQVPCCATSFCKACIEPSTSTEPVQCPICRKVWPFDKLQLNIELENKITSWKKGEENSPIDCQYSTESTDLLLESGQDPSEHCEIHGTAAATATTTKAVVVGECDANLEPESLTQVTLERPPKIKRPPPPPRHITGAKHTDTSNSSQGDNTHSDISDNESISGADYTKTIAHDNKELVDHSTFSPQASIQDYSNENTISRDKMNNETVDSYRSDKLIKSCDDHKHHHGNNSFHSHHTDNRIIKTNTDTRHDTCHPEYADDVHHISSDQYSINYQRASSKLLSSSNTSIHESISDKHDSSDSVAKYGVAPSSKKKGRMATTCKKVDHSLRHSSSSTSSHSESYISSPTRYDPSSSNVPSHLGSSLPNHSRATILERSTHRSSRSTLERNSRQISGSSSHEYGRRHNYDDASNSHSHRSKEEPSKRIADDTFSPFYNEHSSSPKRYKNHESSFKQSKDDHYSSLMNSKRASLDREMHYHHDHHSSRSGSTSSHADILILTNTSMRDGDHSTYSNPNTSAHSTQPYEDRSQYRSCSSSNHHERGSYMTEEYSTEREGKDIHHSKVSPQSLLPTPSTASRFYTNSPSALSEALEHSNNKDYSSERERDRKGYSSSRIDHDSSNRSNSTTYRSDDQAYYYYHHNDRYHHYNHTLSPYSDLSHPHHHSTNKYDRVTSERHEERRGDKSLDRLTSSAINSGADKPYSRNDSSAVGHGGDHLTSSVYEFANRSKMDSSKKDDRHSRHEEPKRKTNNHETSTSTRLDQKSTSQGASSSSSNSKSQKQKLLQRQTPLPNTPSKSSNTAQSIRKHPNATYDKKNTPSRAGDGQEEMTRNSRRGRKQRARQQQNLAANQDLASADSSGTNSFNRSKKSKFFETSRSYDSAIAIRIPAT